jgi:signal transduction histidine kinase
MLTVKKISMSDVKIAKSPASQQDAFGREPVEIFTNSSSHFLEAIENADGVPYHLIFGPNIGEGYYLNLGEGIKQLMDIVPEKFTEELYHKMIEEIIPLSDDIPLNYNEARQKFKSGELKKYKAEVLVRMPSGGKKWIRDSSLPVYDEETGRVIGSFGILFDISEQKLCRAHAEMAEEKAVDIDRLKTAFVQNISHEIRTPLNAIVGFSSLLCDPVQDNEHRKEFLDIITNNTDHLLEVLDNIVEISRIEANAVRIKRKEVNLNSVLIALYNQFSPKASEKKIKLCYVSLINEDQITINTDEYKLGQILKNLIGNAIKFTKEGKIEFGYFLNRDNIEFYVSDSGIGIPSDLHPWIFSRFFQAENSSTRRFEGTGIGLSISRSYVEMLGGKIWFSSQEGIGSVFSFTLPYLK